MSIIRANYLNEPIQVTDMEEADTKIILQIGIALKSKEIKTIFVRSVNSDILVLLIGHFENFCKLEPDVEICLSIGTGEKKRYFNIRKIYTRLGSEKSSVLPFFNALTGADCTSSFLGKGKIK